MRISPISLAVYAAAFAAIATLGHEGHDERNVTISNYINDSIGDVMLVDGVVDTAPEPEIGDFIDQDIIAPGPDEAEISLPFTITPVEIDNHTHTHTSTVTRTQMGTVTRTDTGTVGLSSIYTNYHYDNATVSGFTTYTATPSTGRNSTGNFTEPSKTFGLSDPTAVSNIAGLNTPFAVALVAMFAVGLAAAEL